MLPRSSLDLGSSPSNISRPHLLPTATVEQTGRIGRYTVPIELVVDPRLHHLNVAVALGESVAGEESGDPSPAKISPLPRNKTTSVAFTT